MNIGSDKATVTELIAALDDWIAVADVGAADPFNHDLLPADNLIADTATRDRLAAEYAADAAAARKLKAAVQVVVDVVAAETQDAQLWQKVGRPAAIAEVVKDG